MQARRCFVPDYSLYQVNALDAYPIGRCKAGASLGFGVPSMTTVSNVLAQASLDTRMLVGK